MLKKWLKQVIKSSFILLLLFSANVSARDLGSFGATFPIIEENLLDVLRNKIQKLAENGGLERHQKSIFQKMTKNIEKPAPVVGLIKTTNPRTYLYDPSITLPYDLKDHKNTIFHKAGTIINPLDSHALKMPLLFINGEDEAQVKWALSYKKSNPKIILVQGAPFELMKKYDIPIYFDQGGTLIKKFGITQVPAKITQEGRTLKVEEVLPSEEYMS